jgi:hypothetical protein
VLEAFLEVSLIYFYFTSADSPCGLPAVFCGSKFLKGGDIL